jgi:predicted TIM-barrel fold metal-dependent hydrolase
MERDIGVSFHSALHGNSTCLLHGKHPEGVNKVALGYVKAAPERMVWGSDWPHPTEKADSKPDDAILFDLLADWAPDEATRNRIPVDNPVALYGFG